MTACTGDRDSVMLIPGDKNVGQVIFKDEIQQFFAGMRDCPTILRVMLHNQTVGFRNLLEAFVVIGIATAGVLDRVDTSVVMAHLV